MGVLFLVALIRTLYNVSIKKWMYLDGEFTTMAHGDKAIQAAGQTFRLPFYFVDTKMIHMKIFRPELSEKYKEHLDAERNKTLRDMYPKHEKPIAAMFVERSWIEECLWAETDDEGFLSTDDPFLAAYALKAAQNLNPAARLHPYSKLLTPDDYEQLNKRIRVPGPKTYNMVPKNKLVLQG